MGRSVNPDEWKRDVAASDRTAPPGESDDERTSRRLSDRRWRERRRADRWGRYVERGALLAMVVIMVVGWTRYDAQQHSLDRLVTQQRAGRAVAIDTLCGATSAVVDAGRATLLATSIGPHTRFERNLERLGYPPYAVRRAQARATAKAYGQSIAVRVEHVTNHKGLARPDGTINCKALRAASHAP